MKITIEKCANGFLVTCDSGARETAINLQRQFLGAQAVDISKRFVFATLDEVTGFLSVKFSA